MIQNESSVIVTDNTGVKRGKVIRIMKGSNAKEAGVGDIVKIAIKDAASTSTYKKGTTALALIVRTKKEIARSDGTYLRFSDNAVIVMMKDQKDQLKAAGKRIFGPVAREIRARGFKDIASMAEEVI